jgi:hypothetical protein
MVADSNTVTHWLLAAFGRWWLVLASVLFSELGSHNQQGSIPILKFKTTRQTVGKNQYWLL